MACLFRYCQEDPARQELYRYLYPALYARQTAIPLGNCSPYEVNAVIKDILLDHPELCHFEGKWAYDENAALPQYILSPEAIGQTWEAAAAAFAGMDKTCLPQQAYTWLLAQVAYDPAAPCSQNAYGALVQRRAVCKGIAKAYQLLLNLGNIPCILVEGSLDGVMKHVWNLVFWEDSWLHVDVTMGYPCFWPLTQAQDPSGGLLRTTSDISRSHAIRNPDALPTKKQEAIIYDQQSF